MKPGYKQSEVGAIPEEWDVKTVDQVAVVTSGKRLPLGTSLTSRPTKHPYIRVTDMRPGTVELSEIKYVPDSVFPAIKRFRIYCEDLFISVAGSLGIVGKIPKELDGANLTENANMVTDIKCSQDYLMNVLMSPLIQNTVNSLQTIGAQPKLALTRIRKFSIPHPPLREQRAIAEALSDMDALLGALDRLIAKKRDLKQAAMQQLLSGQTRLPGFNSAWEISSVGQEFEIKLGKMLDAEKNIGIPKPYIGNRAVQWNEIDINDLPTVPMSREDLQRYRLRKGDILVCEGGEVGRAAIWLDPIGECYYQKALHRLRPLRGFNPKLMTLLLRDWSDRGVFSNYVTQTSIAHLPREKFMEIPVPVPSIPEQAAIAEIATDMDAELIALEERREKTRALKQGMMQELLTGRTRLIPSKESHA
jgi:type I restriction enzyme S subunit